MKGYLVGVLTGGRDVAFCHTEHLWHVISDEDDVKRDKQEAEEANAKHRAQLPVGSKIGNR